MCNWVWFFAFEAKTEAAAHKRNDDPPECAADPAQLVVSLRFEVNR